MNIENANKEVKIDYDFYRIGTWRDSSQYTTDKFITFINGKEVSTYTNNNDTSVDLKKIPLTKTEKLDAFGNIKLGFGAYIKDNYIEQTSWGVDNIKFSLTSIESSSTNSSNKLPYICAMTGIGSASQMYCCGNVGRSVPILSTSLYDVGKISTINKLFITQESEKSTQMAFDNFNNAGSLFLKYPTYIGGFDYPFYFK